jgi:hypothetical protein
VTLALYPLKTCNYIQWFNVSIFSAVPARVQLGIMAFFMFFITQMIRSNLYIARVGMTDVGNSTNESHLNVSLHIQKCLIYCNGMLRIGNNEIIDFCFNIYYHDYYYYYYYLIELKIGFTQWQ